MRASQTDRERWLARTITTALELEIMNAEDLLAHVTPELLAAYLPPDVMTAVLQLSLKSGLMTPDTILNAAGPEVLCRHIPPAVLWDAAHAVAIRANIAGS